MNNKCIAPWMRNFLFLACILVIPNPSFAWYGANPDVEVTDQVSQTGPNQWTFQYSITNNTECSGMCYDTLGGIPVLDTLRVIDFYIPYFDDAGIDLGSILSPASWSVTVDTNLDLFGLGNGVGVMHWSTNLDFGIEIGSTLGGFGYTAEFSGAKAPFQAEFLYIEPFNGDLLIPASPNAVAAGLNPVSSVPLPSALLLFGTGLFGLVSTRIKRNKNQILPASG